MASDSDSLVICAITAHSDEPEFVPSLSLWRKINRTQDAWLACCSPHNSHAKERANAHSTLWTPRTSFCYLLGRPPVTRCLRRLNVPNTPVWNEGRVSPPDNGPHFLGDLRCSFLCLPSLRISILRRVSSLQRRCWRNASQRYLLRESFRVCCGQLSHRPSWCSEMCREQQCLW